MTFGSLFAGIGGFDLGFERAGMRCVWQVEIDPYCRRVLAKHWPDVPKFNDVTKFCRRIGDCEPENEDGEVVCPRCGIEFGDCECVGTDQLIDTCGHVDVICGGFPCQPVSNAGHRHGDNDDRWLWPEFLRIVGELQPKYAVVENVGSLTVRGLRTVMGGFCEIGFDAEWTTLSASSFGASHRRERLFIVAYPAGNRLERRDQTKVIGKSATAALDNLHDWPAISAPFGLRSTDGLPGFVDRINGLGNAVVPQVAEWIGRRLMEASS